MTRSSSWTFVGRDLARDDPAEEAVSGHAPLRSTSTAPAPGLGALRGAGSTARISPVTRSRPRRRPPSGARSGSRSRGRRDRRAAASPRPARGPRRGRPSGRRGAGSRRGRASPCPRLRRANAAFASAPTASSAAARCLLRPLRDLAGHARRRASRAGRSSGRRGARPGRGADEGERAVEGRVVLRREAGDHVGVDGDARDRGPDPLDDARVVGRGVAAAHPAEHAVVAATGAGGGRAAACAARRPSRRRAARRRRAAARWRRGGSARPASRRGSGGRGPASVRALRGVRAAARRAPTSRRRRCRC